MKNRYYRILSLFFVAISFYACSDTDVIDRVSNDFYLKISLNVPHSNPSNNKSTRAISSKDETEITNIKMLVFDNSDRLLYSAAVGEINRTTNSPTSTHSVKVKLTKTTESVYLCVLANVSYIPSLVKGQSKAEIFKNIKFESNGKWNAASSSNFRPFPMWGQSEKKPISSSSNFSTISLLRSVASVDVSIPEGSSAYSNFKIRRIYLYNAKNKGFVVPNTSSEYMSGSSIIKAYVPADAMANSRIEYYVADAGKTSYINEIYLAESNNKFNTNENATCLVIGGYYGSGSGLKETFYRADFAQPDPDGLNMRRDILRNYKYKFKIEQIKGPGFDNPEDAFNSLSIDMDVNVIMWNENLKNLKYDGQYVLSVDKDIIETYAEASENTLKVKTDFPKGWVAKVTEGQDWLSLVNASSQGVSQISGTANNLFDMKIRSTDASQIQTSERVGKIKITAGRIEWDVKVVQSKRPEPKLTIKREFSGRGSSDVVDIHENGSIINVDFLKNKDAVSAWEPYIAYNKITIDWNGDEEIYMMSNGPKIVDLSDRHLPSGAISLELNREVLGTTFDTPEITQTLSFYTLKDDKPDRLIKIVHILKARYGARAYYHSEMSGPTEIQDGQYSGKDYQMDGGLEHFYLKANAPFKISIEKNASIFDAQKKVLASTDLPTAKFKWNTQNSYSIGYREILDSYIKGSKVDFSTLDDSNFDSLIGDLVFKVESTDKTKPFETKRFKLKLSSVEEVPSSNCYMISANDKAILIPLDRVIKHTYKTNPRLQGKLDMNDLRAKLIWTDNENGIAANSNIKNLKFVIDRNAYVSSPLDIVKKSYLLVAPGTRTGNCLVGVSNKGGMFYWSWHIWNTPYKPDKTKKYMDRNLGAIFVHNNGDENGRLTNIWNAELSKDYYKSTGTLYQWGRKDPFLSCYQNDNAYGSSYFDTRQTTPYYYTIATSADNSITERLVAQRIKEDREDIGIGDAINNPDILYSNNKRWLNSAYDDVINFYWNEFEKTDWDPCPYGWRTPLKQDMEYILNTIFNERKTTPVVWNVASQTPAFGFAITLESEQSIYLPISTYYNPNDSPATYSKLAKDGRMWTANMPSKKNPYYLYLPETDGRLYAYGGAVDWFLSPNSALPIRCVRNDAEN